MPRMLATPREPRRWGDVRNWAGPFVFLVIITTVFFLVVGVKVIGGKGDGGLVM